MKEENNLPEPLISADVDVRGLPGFVLDVNRLLASELVALGKPEECWAAMMLWCRAWQQTPACSLPNDDRILSTFSGAGKRWPKVKEMALRGFILCSDGRLYHRVLAAEAAKASNKRASIKKSREADNARLKEWRKNKGKEETHSEEGFNNDI